MLLRYIELHNLSIYHTEVRNLVQYLRKWELYVQMSKDQIFFSDLNKYSQ